MKKLLLALLLIAIAVSACSPAKTDLAKNREKWTRANISHYRFQLAVGCFCAFTQQMPLTIEVKDGESVSITNNAGETISAELAEIFKPYDTIERLFDYTAQAQKDADEIKVEYDATYGFPTQVNIDYIKNAADDELSLSVSNFEELK